MNNTTRTIQGYIASYSPDRGFGFICDDKKDKYFFHISNLDRPFDIMPGKTRVVFEGSTNSKGLCAINVKNIFLRSTESLGRLHFQTGY